MSPIRRTQIRNYDFHDAAQEKILPDLIESDNFDLEIESLLNNLNRIRALLKKTTGEDVWLDDPVSNIRELAGRTFSTATLDTWGIIARLQGMIVAPEGPVSDDGNGNIVVPNILVSNPLTGTYVRIQGFSAQLGENSYVYFDLPPTSSANQTLIPTIVQNDPLNPPSSTPFPQYPGEDRVVLCQRIGTGKVWFRFNWAVDQFS